MALGTAAVPPLRRRATRIWTAAVHVDPRRRRRRAIRPFDARQIDRRAAQHGGARGTDPTRYGAGDRPGDAQTSLLSRSGRRPAPLLWGQADIVLHGRVAVPTKAFATDYEFRHPTVELALRDVLARIWTTGRRALSNWLAGVVVGVAAGVLTLTFPTLGWLIVLAFLLGLIRAAPRLPAVGGLFFGLGTAWLVCTRPIHPRLPGV